MFCYHDVWDTSQLPTQGKPSYFRNPDARVLNDNRHRGRINMVFLDGHAATKMYKDIARRDFDYLWVK